MTIRELDTVVLTRDVPDLRLKAGDAGAVVFVHEAAAAYEVEFVALDGTTIGVVQLGPDDLRAAQSAEIPRARARA